MVNCSPSVAVISVDLSAVFLSRDKSAVEISFLSYPLPPYEATCVTRCIVVPLISEPSDISIGFDSIFDNDGIRYSAT